jgi:predicted SnoaL-like aldol condensation-catalyzing enzyme
MWFDFLLAFTLSSQPWQSNVGRIENGRLAEHWDVLQDEATKAESKSGLPMFGDRFTA